MSAAAGKHVYFIRMKGTVGPIKIGYSSDVDTRLTILESGNPVPLELLATYPGNGEVERRFHAKFAGSYIHREWFEATPELLDMIEAINSVTFDIRNLPGPISPIVLRRRAHPKALEPDLVTT